MQPEATGSAALHPSLWMCLVTRRPNEQGVAPGVVSPQVVLGGGSADAGSRQCCREDTEAGHGARASRSCTDGKRLLSTEPVEPRNTEHGSQGSGPGRQVCV